MRLMIEDMKPLVGLDKQEDERTRFSTAITGVPCRAINPQPSITSMSTGPFFPPGPSGEFHSLSCEVIQVWSSSLLPALVTT